MIKLSIVIPHYNSVDMLEKLILSIPDRKEIQIIVVDDNSNRNVEQLEHIKQLRGNLLFFTNHTGKNSAGTCRNIGLQHAQGQWLLFADADDFFVDGFYEIAEKFFDATADIIYFTPTSIELKTGKKSNRHESFESLVKSYIEKRDRESEVRLRYYQEGPISKLIRREIVEDNDIRFDNTMVANDVMFSIKCAYYAASIEAAKEIIYCITKGNSSLTADKKKENYYIRLRVFIDKYKFLKKNLSKQDWKSVDLLGEHYIKLARAYGLNFFETVMVYVTLFANGVRLSVSRKWTISKIVKKILRLK